MTSSEPPSSPTTTPSNIQSGNYFMCPINPDTLDVKSLGNSPPIKNPYIEVECQRRTLV